MTAPATNLTTIISKVRKITARPSINQIDDTEIQNYINWFYLYTLPESLRLLNLRDYYTFTTTPNIDTYAFDPQAYISIEPCAYCAQYTMEYHQDPDSFAKRWPSLTNRNQVSTGNGGAGPYTFNIPNTPFLRSTNVPLGGTVPYTLPTIGTQQNVLIEAPSGSTVVTAQDDGIGGFSGPAVGTIDYLTGATTVTFGAPIAAGTAIYAQTINYAVSRPNTILFYANQFVLRPVPDTAYFIKVQAYRKPTTLLNSAQSPELQEWWELLAFGAALKIFADNGDFEQMAAFRPYYEEQLLYMQRRTLKQYQNQRASSIYAPGAVGFAYPNNYPNI